MQSVGSENLILGRGGRNTGFLVLWQTTEADQRWAGVWEGEYVYLPNSDSAPFICYYQKKDTIITNAHRKNARSQILWFGEGLTQQRTTDQTVGEVRVKREPTQPANQIHHTLPPLQRWAQTHINRETLAAAICRRQFLSSTWTTLLHHTLNRNVQHFCCPLGFLGSNAHSLWTDLGERSLTRWR